MQRHLQKMGALLRLAGHVLEKERLEPRTCIEGYLADWTKFQKVGSSDSDPLTRLCGAYLVADMDRGVLIRSGEYFTGFVLWWKGHVKGLKTISQWVSTFYYSYPDKSVKHKSPARLGTFQQIVQLCGIGFDLKKRKDITALFEWDEAEVKWLETLSGKYQDLDHRKCNHLAYLLECIYAVAIKPGDNISSNPSCEWELRLYSDQNKPKK
jgi:hypothetical protein